MDNNFVSMGQKSAAILVFRPTDPHIGTKIQTNIIFLSTLRLFCTKRNYPPAYGMKNSKTAVL